MKSFLLGVAVAILIAVGVGMFFPLEPTPAWQAFSTENVRMGDDPGYNLVGPNWTGLNHAPLETGGGEGRSS